MALRIDWQKIKAVWPTDETVILTMSRRAASVLLSVMGNLEYKATFREADYDYSDWDDLQSILSEADYELGAAMPLTELIEYIDEVEGLLRVIRDRTGCCPGETDPTGGDYYTDNVVDGVDNVPQNIIDAGYAADSADWAGFDDYKCMIANIFVQSQAETCYKLGEIVDDVGTIAGGIVAVIAVIGAIFASGGTALLLGILAAASTAATLYEKLTEQNDAWLIALGDKVIANGTALTCAVYQGDGTDDSLADYEAKVDQLFTTTEATILKLFNQKAILKALYAGRYDQINTAQTLADAGYDTAQFSCDCEITTADWVCHWDVNLEDWESGGDVNGAQEEPSYYRIVADTSTGSTRSAAGPTGVQMETRYGLPSGWSARYIYIKFMFKDDDAAGLPRQTLKYKFIENGTIVHESPTWDSDVHGYNQWIYHTLDMGANKVRRGGFACLAIDITRHAVAGDADIVVDYIAGEAE